VIYFIKNVKLSMLIYCDQA